MCPGLLLGRLGNGGRSARTNKLERVRRPERVVRAQSHLLLFLLPARWDRGHGAENPVLGPFEIGSLSHKKRVAMKLRRSGSIVKIV